MRSALLRALSPRTLVGAAAPLAELLRRLKGLGYSFTTVTPATHARVLASVVERETSLADIFGWSRPFRPSDLDVDLFGLLRDAGALIETQRGLRSAYRVSTLGTDLFLHSAFPTDSVHSIFFGPDTYRFARFIKGALPGLRPPATILDMGAGTGAGGVYAVGLVPSASLTLVDVNPAALAVAAINAEVAGVKAELIETDHVPRAADLILANPPYMMDASARAYRDGGRLFGGEVALRWVEQALELLEPEGAMLLYTGAAACDGAFPLVAQLEVACERAGASLTLNEIDPDVFGEELDRPEYAQVERIAAVGAVITRE